MQLFLRLLITLTLLAPLVLRAAEAPPALEPLPEPPPPPAGYEPNPNGEPEPEIVIKKDGENTIEEYSVNGQVYMQKVTPSNGVPYYLVKESIDGGWARMDGPGERMAIPQWILFRF